jgi:protocatechuate 3,4-dioxygenase beta subunit
LVVGSTLGSCYPITGRVYFDANGTGRFTDPDVGLANVHVFLDNGESVTTDAYGRYDFPCVHPGMHALRLDATTLPAGVVPFDDRNIDSEKSTRRLVHHIYDTTIIEDINFAVTGTLRPAK